MRQWRRSTKGMSKAKILENFHACDTNGDGQLNKKEFMKLLKLFGMNVSAAEVDTLINRFDMDGDGELDLNEFMGFVEKELQQLTGGNLQTSGGSLQDSTGAGSSENLRSVSVSAATDVRQLKNNKDVTHVKTAGGELQKSKKQNATTTSDTIQRSVSLRKPGIERTSDLDRTQDLYSKIDENKIISMLQTQAVLEAKLGKKYYG